MKKFHTRAHHLQIQLKKIKLESTVFFLQKQVKYKKQEVPMSRRIDALERTHMPLPRDIHIFKYNRRWHFAYLHIIFCTCAII